MNYLNCGCGQRFHVEWTNIDSVPRGTSVLVHDLKNGIPFQDQSFEVVYHSHLLEHFAKADADGFLRECFRVLRPQGILRVAVPDLEQIARTYLLALEQADAGSAEWAASYEWMMLELYDQTVRHRSGGEMATYLLQESVPNQTFIFKRVGYEAMQLIERASQKRLNSQKARSKSSRRLCQRMVSWKYWREQLIKRLLGADYKALQIGRFRQNGEIHQWMYDRYSLRVMLERCGFINVTPRSATDSAIPHWAEFQLDADTNGVVYKPDSLFMEAIKA